MKSEFVLLLTKDAELEGNSTIAAAACGARLIVTRTPGEALQMICRHGSELDLVAIDLDNGTRGTILLNALKMLRDRRSVVALTSNKRDHVTEIADAHGVCCLTKPTNAAELEMAIRALRRTNIQFQAG